MPSFCVDLKSEALFLCEKNVGDGYYLPLATLVSRHLSLFLSLTVCVR